MDVYAAMFWHNAMILAIKWSMNLASDTTVLWSSPSHSHWKRWKRDLGPPVDPVFFKRLSGNQGFRSSTKISTALKHVETTACVEKEKQPKSAIRAPNWGIPVYSRLCEKPLHPLLFSSLADPKNPAVVPWPGRQPAASEFERRSDLLPHYPLIFFGETIGETMVNVRVNL